MCLDLLSSIVLVAMSIFIGGALVKFWWDMATAHVRDRLNHWYDLRDKRAGVLEGKIAEAMRDLVKARMLNKTEGIQRHEARFYNRLEELVKLCRERTIMLEEEAGENKQGGSHE